MPITSMLWVYPNDTTVNGYRKNSSTTNTNATRATIQTAMAIQINEAEASGRKNNIKAMRAPNAIGLQGFSPRSITPVPDHGDVAGPDHWGGAGRQEKRLPHGFLPVPLPDIDSAWAVIRYLTVDLYQA